MFIKNIRKVFWKVRFSIDRYLPSFLRTSYQLMNLGYMEIFTNLKNKKILVVGMGQGLEIPAMFDRGLSRVVGVDPYPIPTFPVEKYGKKLKIIKSKAESLPLKDNSFDIVYSVATLEHVENPQEVVNEMMRVLKPKGIFYCMAGPLWNSFEGFHPKKKYHLLKDWFHLGRSLKEAARTIDISVRSDYLERLEIIYCSNSYNRLPCSVYYDIASGLLKNYTPLEIDFYLTRDRLKELKKTNNRRYRELTKMYSERELVTDCFRWIFIK